MHETTASSPQMLRRMNSGAVLRFALRVAEFTAAEAMAETALTRSTVLGVCDDLVAAGWLEELEDSRAAGLTSKGRPARRYRLRDGAGIVVGLDAGEHRYTAVVADLRGHSLAERSTELDAPSAGGADRLAAASALVESAVAAAGRGRDDILLTVVGVPAPVDADGRSPRGTNDFWATMNPGFPGVLGGAVVVENDANLAAVAEKAHAHDPGDSDVATVLSGERLGAGVILDGRLLRGARGGAGEMRFLDIVEGAGSPAGIGALARLWARAAVEEGSPSALAALAPDEIDAERVFAAAADGDALALDIIARLGARISRVAAVLSSLLDVDKVVIAGAIADAVDPVLAHARAALRDDFSPPVPDVVASTLGRDVVVLGAVELALSRVREEPLAFTPRHAS
ncbi:ROK family protein [Microbacterium betulae]|uniref:ROK family protein n=1 Tax=Microbacterium betulae TaxID=2981139 RepID=A0AA97FI86_9MICO|nr:ROK family protein [Microbacterium sp. AB]WOF22775.1 ROK family protein [Microbacterium sp. AB]